MSDNNDETDPNPFLDLAASFSLSLSGLGGEMKRLNDHYDAQQQRARAALPRNLPLIQQSTSATTVDLLDFGGPQAGRQWEIRLLGVVSATSAGFVAMAATFTTWYVGQKMTGNAPGILPIAQARWQFPTVPAFNDFSGDSLKVLPNEHLLAGLTGIPAAPTQIMCIAVINDLPLYTGRAVVSG
jgi:hypothetical protein